jgi:hypothetical protein
MDISQNTRIIESSNKPGMSLFSKNKGILGDSMTFIYLHMALTQDIPIIRIRYIQSMYIDILPILSKLGKIKEKFDRKFPLLPMHLEIYLSCKLKLFYRAN